MKPGDTAIATKQIDRVDRRCSLLKGEKCTITQVSQSDTPGVEIVGISFDEGKNQMISIVVENNIPLKPL